MTQRPEVEPLSAAAWARIRNGVVADLDRRRLAVAAAPASSAWRGRRGALALAGAAALAVGVALVVTGGSSEEPAAASWRVATEAEPSVVTLDGAEIRVAARSSVLVEVSDDGGVSLGLERGAVECEVEPRGPRPPLSVRAAGVLVEVVGTHFAVALRDSEVRVEVSRGVVRVLEQGREHRVGAGQVWSSAPSAGALPVESRRSSETRPSFASRGRPESKRTADSSDSDAPSQAALDRAGATPLAAEADAARSSGAAGEASVGSGVAQPSPGGAPAASTEASSPRLEEEETARSSTSSGRVLKSAAGKRSNRARESSVAAPSKSKKRRQTARRSDEHRLSKREQRQLFARAQTLAATDSDAAIALFGRVARGAGTWAALALYAQADLELQRGNLATASSLLREYLRRFPHGRNAADARRSLEQIE